MVNQKVIIVCLSVSVLCLAFLAERVACNPEPQVTFSTDWEGGKRAAQTPEFEKRRAGWGKRSPGWGKRSPGWGKRTVSEDIDISDQLVNKVSTHTFFNIITQNQITLTKCLF
jgi:hypothetical protein